MTLPLRTGPQPLDDTPESNPASLLFYYLFDDWHTSYSLVARSEHRYGEQLEELVRPPSLPLPQTNKASPLTRPNSPAQKHVRQSLPRQHRPPAPHRPPTLDPQAHLPKLRHHHRRHPRGAKARPRPQRQPGGPAAEVGAGRQRGVGGRGGEFGGRAGVGGGGAVRTTQGSDRVVCVERDSGVFG